jgi:hypothetical protein
MDADFACDFPTLPRGLKAVPAAVTPTVIPAVLSTQPPPIPQQRAAGSRIARRSRAAFAVVAGAAVGAGAAAGVGAVVGISGLSANHGNHATEAASTVQPDEPLSLAALPVNLPTQRAAGRPADGSATVTAERLHHSDARQIAELSRSTAHIPAPRRHSASNHQRRHDLGRPADSSALGDATSQVTRDLLGIGPGGFDSY